MGLMRLFSRETPKIKVETTKSDNFSGWLKCSGCEETIHKSELAQNLNCCSKCDFHYRMSASQRIELICDANSFEELFGNLKPKDPLQFEDTEKYTDRIERAQTKTKRNDAIMAGTALIDEMKTAIAIMDFSYMGGSMGSVVGEVLTRMIEYATEHGLPLVILSASGGARMQESILSLMQMAKTSAALAKHSEAGLPYISVITNPTTGGVTASFATLGDVIISEPKALFGFTGPRVLEQTIGAKLPEGAQKAEFLLEKGMIDCIAPRHMLKESIATFIRFLTTEK